MKASISKRFSFLIKSVFTLKKIGFLSFTFLVNIASNAQTFEWAKLLGGPAGGTGRDMVVDATGNVYTVGDCDAYIQSNCFSNLNQHQKGISVKNWANGIYVLKMEANHFKFVIQHQ